MSPWQPNRDAVVTILTGVLVLLWVASMVARIWVDLPQATVLDAAMPILIGFWFSTQATKKNGATP